MTLGRVSWMFDDKRTRNPAGFFYVCLISTRVSLIGSKEEPQEAQSCATVCVQACGGGGSDLVLPEERRRRVRWTLGKSTELTLPPTPCRARAFRLPVPLQVHTLSLVLMHSLSSTDSCRADVGVNCSTQHCSSHSGSSNSTKEFKRYTLRSFPIITNPIARDLSFGPAPFFFFFRGDEPISLCYVKTDTGLLIDPIPLIRYSPSGDEGLGTWVGPTLPAYSFIHKGIESLAASGSYDTWNRLLGNFWAARVASIWAKSERRRVTGSRTMRMSWTCGFMAQTRSGTSGVT